MKARVHDEKVRKRFARRSRVRRGIGTSTRARLVVFRSARHIYAQLLDAQTGQTIGTVSTRSKGVMGDSKATGGVEAAKKVGQAIAEMARLKQIDQVVFNRNGFLFHGRVKALAEAAREAGLRF